MKTLNPRVRRLLVISLGAMSGFLIAGGLHIQIMQQDGQGYIPLVMGILGLGSLFWIEW